MTDLERRAALLLAAAAAASSGVGPGTRPDTGPGTAAAAAEPAMLCPEIYGKKLRLQRPGEAVTMEYRADRLTIELDAQDRIVAIRPG